MIRIGILGDIGTGKSYVAKSFGYPVFNADKVVGDLYKKDKKTFLKLKKILPKYFKKFPIRKLDVSNAILDKNENLKKIIKIVHLEIRKKMNIFLLKNKSKRIVVLDIPLLLENKMNNKKDILVFVDSKRTDILRNLKKRKNYNSQTLKKFKKIQFSVNYKKKVSQYIIKNEFTKKSVIFGINKILKKINK